MSIDRTELRKKQKQKRINSAIERRLNKKNEFGINDPTPFEAINGIIEKQKRVKICENE